MSFSLSRFSVGLVFSGLLAASAYGQVPADKKEKDPAETAPAVPPAPADPGGARLGVSAAVDPKTYIIEAEDVVAIKVWREPELSGLFTVRPDGKISMHLVGEVQAGGITPDQLQTRVVEALQTVINRPQVVAAVHEVRSKKYFISGEVMRPGEYRLGSKVSVMEALSMAGGFREFADMKGIKVMRGTERIKFNYKDVIKGKKLEQNIELKNGDHIVVP
jgi:polysaccharide biosynthesis/export protein